MDPRLHFLKEKRTVQSRISLWSSIHAKQQIDPLDPAYMWICTEPKSHKPASSSRFNVRKRVEHLLQQVSVHQNPRTLDRARNLRSQKSSSWEKTRADRLFQQRFYTLPGEVRNQIYDHVLENFGGAALEIPLFRSYTNGKAHHGGAQFRGAVRLPVTPQQNLSFVRPNDPIWNELFDRWCAQVRFYLFEAYEVHLDAWPFHLGRRSRHTNVLLSRYLNTEACQVFGSSSSWFAGMRKCTLSLSLFNVASLLEAGSRGIRALRAEMTEVARVMKSASNIESLHIKVRLWPRRYREQAWNNWPAMSSGEGVLSCLEPLKEIDSVQQISLFAGSLMAECRDSDPQGPRGRPDWNLIRSLPDHLEHCV